MTEERYRLGKGTQGVLFLFMALGAIALGIAFYVDPQRAWSNVLLNNFYFLSLSLSGTFFIAIQYVSNASWGIVLRRIPEAMGTFLPVAAILMLLLYFGTHSLYSWSHLEEVMADPILKHKYIYLNVPFFMIRMAAFFLLWIWFSRKIRSHSLKQDVDGDLKYTRSNIKYSVLFLVLFALTFTLASYDWMMSLEPHWFSTIFSVYTFAGLFFHGIAMITFILLILLSSGYYHQAVHEDHIHDLGKLIFAFSTFWAYCWFCQYMLIWYANIPEETAYFLKRHENGWFPLFLINFAFNWLFPFFFLMARRFKRNRYLLWVVCSGLLVAHWLDIYMMIFPSTVNKIYLGGIELFTGVGYLSLFLWIVLKALERAPLIPIKDPFLHESLKHHQ